MTRKSRSGFTLVELLTVIAIIALLAALIMGLAGNAQRKAARSRAEAEITQLQSFVTEYRTRYGQVPGTAAALAGALVAANHSLTNSVNAGDMPEDPWGIPYRYERSSPATFYLWSTAGDDANRAAWLGNPEP